MCAFGRRKYFRKWSLLPNSPTTSHYPSHSPTHHGDTFTAVMRKAAKIRLLQVIILRLKTSLMCLLSSCCVSLNDRQTCSINETSHPSCFKTDCCNVSPAPRQPSIILKWSASETRVATNINCER